MNHGKRCLSIKTVHQVRCAVDPKRAFAERSHSNELSSQRKKQRGSVLYQRTLIITPDGVSILSNGFQIDDLQQKMLTLGGRLAERNEAVENTCRKYLRLKKRKDEQEALLKGSIETLQV